jgi:sulfoxide reductase heme-binding subunit YedZ
MQDEGLNLGAVAKDIVKRPYITVGTLAYLLMVPLAITSTTAMIRRLGRRWQTLHRLVYATALLGILHWTWLVYRPAQEDRGLDDPGHRAPLRLEVGKLQPLTRVPA